jgi:hypothetical protein
MARLAYQVGFLFSWICENMICSVRHKTSLSDQASVFGFEKILLHFNIFLIKQNREKLFRNNL